MNRTARKRTSFLAMIVVVLAQLAVSAFACGMEFAPRAPAAAAERCHEEGAPDAPLCQRHCHEEAQSQSPAPFVPPSFVPSFVTALPVVSSIAPSSRVPARLLLHATSPPLAIANCCLRV